MNLKEKDVVVFKNGKQTEYDNISQWVLDEFYDENLICKRDDRYTIVDVLRPYYYSIKGMDEVLNVFNMNLEQLRNEVREKRLQVNNLIQEIKRKNELIEKYNNYLNKEMEVDYNRRLENGKNDNVRKKSRGIKKSDK